MSLSIQKPEFFNRAFFRQKFIPCTFVIFLASYFVLPTNKSVNNIYYALVLLPFLLCIRMEDLRTFFSRTENRLLTLFLGYCAIMSFFPTSDAKYLKYLIYILPFFMVVELALNSKLVTPRNLAYLLFFGTCLYVAINIVDFYIIKGNSWAVRLYPLNARMSSPIFTSDLLATFYLPAAYYLIKQKQRALAIGSLILAVGLMIVMQTRSGIAGLAAAFTVLTLFLLFTGKESKKSIVLLLCAGLAICLIFYYLGYFDVLFTRGSSYRLEIFQKITIEAYEQCNIIFGCGYNYEIISTIQDGQGIIAHPHSIYFAHLLFTGIIGLTLLISWIAYVAIMAIKEKNIWALALISGAATLAFDGSKLLDNPDERWLLLFLPVALCSFTRNRYASEPTPAA